MLVLAGGVLGSLPCAVFALGLGDMRSQSYLGQVFTAKIELLNLNNNINSDQILVRHLNSAEAEAMGADAYYGVYTLDVRLQKSAAGFEIFVTSKERVNEPYLSLLIELSWPKGVVYREYPVLLDPIPVVAAAQNNQARVNGNVVSAAETSPRRGQASSSRASGTRATPRQPVTAAAQVDAFEVAQGQYEVRAGDSLWKISSRLSQGSPHSVADINAWIFRSNPRAFSKNSMDFLKAGAVLTLPDIGELAAASLGEPGKLRRTDSEAEQAGARPSGKNALATPVKGSLTVSQLSVDDKSRELIDMLSRENQTLKERIGQMENDDYVATMRELVVLQQEQIQQLQSRLGTENPAKTQADAMLETVGLASQAGGGVTPSVESSELLSKQDMLRELDNIGGEPAIVAQNSDAIIELNPDGVSEIINRDEEKRSRVIALLLLLGGILLAAVLGVFFYYRKVASSHLSVSQDALPSLAADAEVSGLDGDELLQEQGLQKDSIETDIEIPAGGELGEGEDAKSVNLPFEDLDQELADIDLNLDEAANSKIAAAPEVSDRKPKGFSLFGKKAKSGGRKSDAEVKTAIAAKMAGYSSDDSMDEEALSAVELGDLEDFDEGDYDEIDTLVYRAMMFCEFKKFDKARGLIEEKRESDDDPRLEQAMARIDDFEENMNKRDTG